MPTEYRKQMRTLLPYTELNKAVANLAYATIDASGGVTGVTPMQNRPWEWTENLGDSAAMEEKDNGGSKIRNTASLSLELFSAQTTGERVMQQEQNDNPNLTNTILSFEDHMYGESLFQRDWRESRILPEEATLQSPTERAEQEDQVGPLPTFGTPPHGSSSRHTSTRGGSRRPSPASSVRSRTSLHAHNAPSVGSSLRQSPMHPPQASGSSAGDPIDVDSLDPPSTSSRPAKRKADKEPSTSDDSRRSKGKSTAVPKSKKR